MVDVHEDSTIDVSEDPIISDEGEEVIDVTDDATEMDEHGNLVLPTWKRHPCQPRERKCEFRSASD